MTKSSVGLLLLVSVLSACATTEAQRERDRIRSATLSVSKTALDCRDRLLTVQRYAPVYQKFGLGRTAVLPSQLADTEHISIEIIAIGLDWYAEQQICDQRNIEGFGRIAPELGVAAAGWIQEGAQLFQDAVTNKPTYGAINAKLAVLKDRQIKFVRQWYLNVDTRLKQQEAAQIAEQQRQSEVRKQQFISAIGAVTEIAAQTLLLAAQVMADRQAALAQAQRTYIIANPVYVPVRQITTTNCRYIGSTFSCTTF